jgi:hypothetical protein
MIEIRPARTSFGVAEVLGVEPGGDDSPTAELRAALARHAVLCLRMPRKLTDEELQQVARLLGPIKDPVARTKDGS